MKKKGELGNLPHPPRVISGRFKLSWDNGYLSGAQVDSAPHVDMAASDVLDLEAGRSSSVPSLIDLIIDYLAQALLSKGVIPEVPHRDLSSFLIVISTRFSTFQYMCK